MIDSNLITCPKCGEEIPLSNALTGKIKQQIRVEMEKEIKAKEEKITKREKELEESQKNIDEEVRKKVEIEKSTMWEKAQKAAEEKQEKEILDLKAQNEEKNKKLKETEKNELELRKKTRELEEKDKNRELEMERKMDEERKKISEKIQQETDEQSRKKLSEKDQQIEQMRKTINDLKRKSDQGSMQLQGDAQEEALKSLLQENFPIDDIQDVPTGVRGADLIQTVKSDFGQISGIVLWESKNTKQWSDNWITKIKDDQVNTKANIAILMTTTLPNGIKNFTQINGVWVVNFNYVLPIISTIRFHLIALKRTEKALDGQDEKMRFLYQYLSGAQFKNKIENIISAFENMSDDLNKEKRAMTKYWAKREKEIERIIFNTTGMYGDLQGLIGVSLPIIQKLELPSGEDENEEAGPENLPFLKTQ
jgi:hypothetical protein